MPLQGGGVVVATAADVVVVVVGGGGLFSGGLSWSGVIFVLFTAV